VLVYPVPQGVHAVAADVASVPAMFVNNPAAQVEHAVAPELEYCPAVQLVRHLFVGFPATKPVGEQDELPAGEAVPAAQAGHVPVLLAPEHVPGPLAGLQLPARHVTTGEPHCPAPKRCMSSLRR